MMFRTLLDEMMRRRLLPIAAVAVLVAIIAPLLFLKGAPDDAPSADSATPAAAKAAKLPARAARLLAATDAGASRGGADGTSQDPFTPPAAIGAAAAAAASTGSKTTTAVKSTGSVTTQQAPAVVTNNGNAKSSPTETPAPSKSNSSSNSGTKTIAVDIRFGAKKDSKIHRSIPRYKAFYIHGKLVAVFVKYSPSKKTAVFAVAPGLHISGPGKCRVEAGVCKYVDIKAGSYARISMVTASRAVVSRRLDVVHTKARATGSTNATAASGRNEAACLVGKLVAMKPGDSLVDRDACES
jgi:hypothetical protein